MAMKRKLGSKKKATKKTVAKKRTTRTSMTTKGWEPYASDRRDGTNKVTHYYKKIK